MDGRKIPKKYFFYSFFVIVILLIILINPKLFKSTDFDRSFNRTENEHILLDTVEKIKEYIQIRNDFLPNDASGLQRRGIINVSQSNIVISTSTRAKEDFREYKSNGIEKKLYSALFYTQLAISYKTIYPFINCVTEVIDTAQKYHPLFFYLGEYDKEKVLELENTKDRLLNGLENHERYREEPEQIISLTKYAHNIEEDFRLYELRCDQFNLYIQKDYRRQRLLVLFKFLVFVVAIIVSFVLGRILSRNNINIFTEKTESIIEIIKKIFLPKRVEEETISTILKINTVTTTIVAFLGISLTISGLNNILVTILIILSVLSLLSSILTGIVALNNQEEFFKRWCYRLFMFGLFLFIIFFLYLIIFGSLTLIFKGVLESTKNYFSNQTIIK